MCQRPCFTVVGRLNSPTESLFYYDVENGYDFDYYNSSRSYTPVFGVQPTPEQEEEARQVCTIGGVQDTACTYDYYATGNAEACSVSASVYSNYTTAQETLGLFVVSLTSYPR